MEESRRKLFASYLNTYGTDFSYIRQTPEFSGRTDADLLRLYTEHLEEKAQHITARGEESDIKAISKIFRDGTRFRAFVETEEKSPRGGSRLLRLDDYRLPFLLKDREYFLKQQLSFVYEIYDLMRSEKIVSHEFIEEAGPVEGVLRGCGRPDLGRQDPDGRMPATDPRRVSSENGRQDGPGGRSRSLPGNAWPCILAPDTAGMDPEESDSLPSLRGKAEKEVFSAGTCPADADSKTHLRSPRKSRAASQNITKSKLIINKRQKAGGAEHGDKAPEDEAAGPKGAKKEEEENLFSDYLSVSRSLGKSS